jgi:hypothetical protein
MRSEKQMLDSFMPLHEKEWEARLFIDEAIKNKTEYTLEAIARALSGKSNIKFVYAEKDKKSIAMEIAYENQNRCQNLLFKIMGDNINKWWD